MEVHAAIFALIIAYSFSSVTFNQTLWPDHCIQNTSGAAFSPKLRLNSSDVTIHKGSFCWIDSYSAFADNGNFSQTPLDGVLRSAGVEKVFVVGVALDFCVYFTAKDAHFLGKYEKTKQNKQQKGGVDRFHSTVLTPAVHSTYI
jgi:nicotinamidase-related amidase